MGKMPNCYFSLDIDVGEERALVVYPKVKNSMLVRELKAGAVYGTICCLSYWAKVKAMKG